MLYDTVSVISAIDKTHLKDISDIDLKCFEDQSDYYEDAFDALDNLYQQNGVEYKQDVIND